MQRVECLLGDVQAVFTGQAFADIAVLEVCRDTISTKMSVSSESLK